MKEAAIAIGKYLSEKVDEEHVIHIVVQKTGNLPKRVPFICNVYRQQRLTSSWIKKQATLITLVHITYTSLFMLVSCKRKKSLTQ